MLKRVVRRALGSRKTNRSSPATPPRSTPAQNRTEPAATVPQTPAQAPAQTAPPIEAAQPEPASPVSPPEKSPQTGDTKLTGIAARIAAGDKEHTQSTVSATSGAAAAVTSGELSISEDGEAYWGPVDNESSRAKADGKNLIIDQWECISCGVCVENTDAVFHLPDDAKAVVIRQEGDMTLVQDAIDSCPVTCIHWTEDPDEFEQINDAEGHAT